MDIENNFIKPVLLFQFSKGKSEIEAHKEVSKQYGKYAISLKTVKKWFEIFSREYHYSVNKGSVNLVQNLPDDLLTNFINGKSDFNMQKFEECENCSKLTISTRLTHINKGGERSNFNKKGAKKGVKKLSDESVIDLVKNNPDLNMKELAKLAGVSRSTISNRLKYININDQSVGYLSKKIQKDESKTTVKPKKFTDEFLINLVNENPEFGMKDLARIANTSITTISNRLKQINNDGKKVNYTIKGSVRGVKVFTDEYLINLINENPSLNMKELAKLANTTQGTISIKLKQINSCGGKVNYISKRIQSDEYERKYKPKTKFTDEFLIDLVDKNPDLNMEELAKLAGVSRPTIVSRLKEINAEGERVKYRKKDCQRGLSTLTDEFLIDLVNNNPDLNMEELAKLADVSRSTIYNRIKHINTGGERANYRKKSSQKGLLTFSDEFLINLVNENPSLNMQELAKLADTSTATISSRLKQINSCGKMVNYTSKKVKRV